MITAVTVVVLSLFVSAQTIADLQMVYSNKVGAYARAARSLVVCLDRMQSDCDNGTHASLIP